MQAALAAAAGIGIDYRLAVGMLFLLTGTASAAHTDILDGAAETGHLMALEVAQADEDVSVHHSTADLGSLDIFAAFHRNFHIIGTLEAVADENRTAHRHGSKTIFPGTVEMFQRVFPAAGIEGIAVGKEGLAAQGLDYICHRTGIVGTQEAQIAQLTEVHLDGDKLAFHIDLIDTGSADQTLELERETFSELGPEVGIINLGFFHCDPPFTGTEQY